MSMYGDSNYYKNDMYDEIKKFLTEYKISELLEIIKDVLEDM